QKGTKSMFCKSKGSISTMKKPAILAGFLATVLVATLAVQHTVLAMELPRFTLGDISITSEYQENTDDNGEVLAASTEEASVEPEPEAEAAPEPIIVTVVKGDTLSTIARAHDTTYKRLFDANESIANPDIINPG